MPAEYSLSDESGINRLSMPLIRVQQAVMALAWQPHCAMLRLQKLAWGQPLNPKRPKPPRFVLSTLTLDTC